MDTKAIFAIVLSVLVLVGYNFWYFKRYEKTLKEPPTQPTALTTPGSAGTAGGQAGGPSEPAALPTVSPESEHPVTEPAKVAVFPDEGETQSARMEMVEINTGLTKAVLTSQGGRIHDLFLLKYKDDQGQFVNLVHPDQKLAGRLPVELDFPQASFNTWVNRSVYEIRKRPGSTELGPGVPSADVQFVLQSKSGIVVKKEYTFRRDSYDVDLALSIENPGGPKGGIVYGAVWPGLGDEPKEWKNRWGFSGPTLIVDKKRIAEIPAANAAPLVYSGEIPWAGLQNRYYCSVFITQGISHKVQARRLGQTASAVEPELVTEKGGEPTRLRMYAGPKLHEVLKNHEVSLEDIINFGWFNVVAYPLFHILKFLHGVTGNFGVDIILLTVLVKVLFFPLSQKGIVSMQKMQKLQPKMKQIQELYRNDKQKLNEELMKLYRDNQVNPLGGCLPMVLQIPVFFALYKVLLGTVELKQAYFVWWITDLSSKDPYYITPILMGISMYFQQKMTPSVGDPTQQKVMALMPIIFTFMFLNFPSGLVIYWLANNVLTIVQQYLIYKPLKKSSEEART